MIFQQTELSTLVNIGETIERRLNDIGVYTREDLERLGAVEAWRKIKQTHPNQNISARYYLYSLQGALIDRRRTDLPPKLRHQLQACF
jgi:DNA transformation protein